MTAMAWMFVVLLVAALTLPAFDWLRDKWPALVQFVRELVCDRNGHVWRPQTYTASWHEYTSAKPTWTRNSTTVYGRTCGRCRAHDVKFPAITTSGHLDAVELEELL